MTRDSELAELRGKEEERHPSPIIKAKRLPNDWAAIHGGPTIEHELISRTLSKTQRGRGLMRRESNWRQGILMKGWGEDC